MSQDRRRLVVDLHLHSRFSIGTSPSLDMNALAIGAKRVGLDVIAAPDFTHPAWLKEMRGQLAEAGDGVYLAKAAMLEESRPALDNQGSLWANFELQPEGDAGTRFLLATEVSCVWTQDGKGRRVHLLVFAPGMRAVEKLNKSLGNTSDLEPDGRPMLNITARQLAEMAWEADERMMVVPAHAWTPWYGLYGSKSGFDSMEECFGDLAPRISAIETGLSSDPAMNWRVADVDGRAIVSFSDAHSPPAIGREATVLDCAPDFPSIAAAIKGGRIVETLEFHPEHGKYHLDGHRKCGVRMAPSESAAIKGRCPKCGRKLTLGVENRVERLASRPASVAAAPDSAGLVRGPAGRPPFRYVVPLRELLSQALGSGPSSQRVARAYDRLVHGVDGELNVLTGAPIRDVERVAGEAVARVISAARRNQVEIEPGYDGEYGKVRVLA